jgi:hypothetical protein
MITSQCKWNVIILRVATYGTSRRFSRRADVGMIHEDLGRTRVGYGESNLNVLEKSHNSCMMISIKQ